jgi:hypothetical protein
MRRAAGAGWLGCLALVVLLPGCKEQKQAAAPAAGPVDRVRAVAEQAIRAAPGAPKTVVFRGEQVYGQALPQRMAVCGQTNPFADDPNIFVPFVSIVSWGEGQSYSVDQHVGTTTSEATRVYVALVASCYEGGGPAGRGAGMALPPMPDNLPNPAIRPPAAKPVVANAATVPAATAATGGVTTRKNANLHTDPHGATIRTVPQGVNLHVFAQAPGGWYQVGDATPEGWVHESMIDRH